jgi:hypothetical protein
MSGIRSGQCRVQEKLLGNMIGGGSVSVCGLEEGRLPAFLPRTCSIASPPTIKTRPKLQVASRKCFTWRGFADAQLTDETQNGQQNTGIELWPPEVSGSSNTQHERLPGRAGKQEGS